MKDDKLKELLGIVVEHYISKGEPIGSKFLHSLKNSEYAPSTFRKYLNLLEKEGLLYQPYHSAGRIPTAQGLSSYLESILALPEADAEKEVSEVDIHVASARNDLRGAVEKLGQYMDGAVVGFLRADEYYYLGLDNLLKESLLGDVETTRYLIRFIESKEIVLQLDAKLMKRNTVYYTVLDHEEKLIAIMYAKVELNGFDAIIAVLGPARMDHRRNIALLRKMISER